MGLLLGVFMGEAEAQAFCRSTTCKGMDCKRDDDGCPVDGLPLYWPGSCVGFSFQRDFTSKLPPEPVRDTLRKSFLAWTQLPCPGGGQSTLSFSEGDDTVCAASEYNDKGANINVILFRDDDFPYRDEDNTLAKTTVTYDAKNGVILDADIEINSAFNELTISDKRVVYDLQAIMTHEIGHFIGIAHSPLPDATMFASYETGTTELRSLDADDVEAVCTIYPPDRQAFCDPTPHGGEKVCQPPGAESKEDDGCAVGRPGALGGGALGLSAALGALLLRVRRGRAKVRERNA